MKYIFLFLLSVLLSFFFIIPVYAQNQDIKKEEGVIIVPLPEFNTLKHTQSGRVDKVIDGLTVLLKDKTIIRLASLDIPDFHNQREAPYSEKALKLLQDTLPNGTEVLLYQTRKAKKGRENRMGHALGHIVTKKSAQSVPVWVNGALLAQGMARVMVAPNALELFEPMITAEKEARNHKRGIWHEESPYLVLTPDTAGQATGQYALIEGRVEKTASVRNNVYLNFGKDWKTDFTIMVTPALRKKLAQAGIHPLTLGGETVRVRGWPREYNGPLIELDVPEHLELIPAAAE